MQRSGNRLSEKIMLKQKDDAMEKIQVGFIACMLLRLAQQRLKRRLLQPASTAHPGADLPQRKIRVSRYVSSPEPNSHSHKTSDTIAIGYQPSAQAFASPDFVRLNRTRGITIMMPSRLRNGSREFIVGRAVSRVLQLHAIRQEQSIKGGAERALMPAADLEGTA
jgi:hypothetical protein